MQHVLYIVESVVSGELLTVVNDLALTRHIPVTSYLQL